MARFIRKCDMQELMDSEDVKLCGKCRNNKFVIKVEPRQKPKFPRKKVDYLEIICTKCGKIETIIRKSKSLDKRKTIEIGINVFPRKLFSGRIWCGMPGTSKELQDSKFFNDQNELINIIRKVCEEAVKSMNERGIKYLR